MKERLSDPIDRPALRSAEVARPTKPRPQPVGAEMRDQLETWVNEGGAGDDVAR